MIDYNKRLVEVDEILNHLSEEELNKIPEKVKTAIKENKDKDYIWKYDEEKPLKDQNVDRDTIAILSYLNIEYLLNPEQKELMLEIHKINQEKQDQIGINEKYGLEDLFKEEEIIEESVEEPVEDKMIEYNESAFKRFFRKIAEFFKK